MTDEELNEREPKDEDAETEAGEDDEPDFELHGQYFNRPTD